MEVNTNGKLSLDDLNVLMHNTALEAEKEIVEQDSTLTMGAIGAPYQIGAIDCTVAIGNLVLLHEIDSPFITGDIGEEGDELNATECIKSLYVLALGKEAVRPIMAIKQRIQALMNLKTMCEGTPELFQQLLDRAEKIADAHAQFELDALAWYEQYFSGYDFQEVVTGVFGALADIMKSAGDLPESEKKSQEAV